MSIESRLADLERKLGVDDNQPRRAIVVYDPREVPEDPSERDAWLRSQRPRMPVPCSSRRTTAAAGRTEVPE
jgi:hypothetical protein